MPATDIPKLIARWDEVMESARTAAEKRLFDSFQVAFNDGCRCFEQLQAALEGPDRQIILDSFIDDIHRLGAECNQMAEKLHVWMTETHEQAQKMRKDDIVERKIAGAYGYFRKSGNVLRIIR